MNEIITCAASLTIGLSLGLIGAGGSILTIPVFVYILKIDPLASGVYSMFVVGICSMVGTIRSITNKMVDFTIAIQFGIPSMMGVFIARRLIYPAIPLELFSFQGITLTKKLLFMLCIAVLMFTAALRMLTVSGKNQGIGRQKKQKTDLLIIRGFLVGGLTGLLGIGGGFLIVPALYLWTRLTMKMVVGTTLLIITINSLFSFLTSYSTAFIDWSLLLKFSAGASLGILIGIRVAEKITGDYLKTIFGWFVMSISFFILYRQFFF